MKLFVFYFLFIFVVLSRPLQAQLIAGDIFFRGNYIEAGIASNGTIGSGKSSPVSYHSLVSGASPARLGIVADPDKDGWVNGKPAYIGDYILPGFPGEEWDIQVNGITGRAQRNVSDSAFTAGLSGYNVSYSSYGNLREGRWIGKFEGLNIEQKVTIDVNQMYVLFTVKLKNTMGFALNDIYYNRIADPDNEVEQVRAAGSSAYSGYATRMKIVNQVPNTKQQVIVSAAGDSFKSYIAICSKDCRARAYFVPDGLLPNDRLDTLYAGIGKASVYFYNSGSTYFNDVGMGMVFNIGTIDAGDSTIITYAYLLKQTELDYLYDKVFAPDWNYKDKKVANKDTIKACENEMVDIGINYSGTDDWLWEPAPYLSYTSGISNSILAKGTNTYRATRAEHFPCTGNDTVFITIKAVVPVKPVLIKSGLTLTCSGKYSSYTWFKGDTILSSAFRSYKMLENGNYYVRVVDENGCVSYSDTVLETSFAPTSVRFAGRDTSVNVYPNPANDKIFISAATEVNASLFDISGRQLFSQQNAKELDLRLLADGIYLLHLKDQSGQILGIRRIVKNQ